MIYFFSIIIGMLSGFLIKLSINWLEIDGYKVKKSNFLLEIICPIPWSWFLINMPLFEAIMFSLIVMSLIAIAFIDFHTMQIPLVYILFGIFILAVAIFKKSIYLSSALWGIFVGAIIPLIIVGFLWLITKRQGMGFGDIQMGIVLGAWLGPMRMAITLFLASVLSLLVWLIVSLVHGFDKNRAMPMAPFLSVAGTSIFVGSFYYPELFHLLII